MPRAISSELLTHIAGEVTTLCTLWQVTRRDGVEFYFTDLDINVTYNGNTYSAATYSRTAIQADSAMSVDNLEVTALLDSEILSAADLRAGMFDFSFVTILVVNYMDLTMGACNVRSGYLGEVSLTPSGVFSSELRGMMQLFANSLVELYTAVCKANLGDARCKMPIEPPVLARSTAYQDGTNNGGQPDFVKYAFSTGEPGSFLYGNRILKCIKAGTTGATPAGFYDPTVGNSTTDGTAVFEAHESWARAASVTALDDDITFHFTTSEPRAGYNDPTNPAVHDQAGGNDPWWWNQGLVVWESGLNIGRAMEVRVGNFSSTDATVMSLVLFEPPPWPVAIGDIFRIIPGCDHLASTCQDKFINLNNFRGTPYIPGNDVLLRVAVSS